MLRNIRCLGGEEFDLFGRTWEGLERVMMGFSGEGRLKEENGEREDKVKGEERWIFGKLDEGLRVKVGEG